MRQKATRSKASGAIVEYMGAIAGVRPKPYGAIDFYSFGGGSHAAMAVCCSNVHPVFSPMVKTFL
jgi:hypothetical protein